MSLNKAIEDMEIERWAALTRQAAQDTVERAKEIGRTPPVEVTEAAAMTTAELINRRKAWMADATVRSDLVSAIEITAQHVSQSAASIPAAEYWRRLTEEMSSFAQTQSWSKPTDTLVAGNGLSASQRLMSNNGAYVLNLQEDGNVVLTDNGIAVWESKTSGHRPGCAVVQSDGNFAVYDRDGNAVWNSGTKGRDNVRLVLQDDRNLVLYSGNSPVWMSNTATDTPPSPPKPRTYTVESGDTLWAIAERFYGDGNQFQKIADASGIANPDLIEPGKVLMIPE